MPGRGCRAMARWRCRHFCATGRAVHGFLLKSDQGPLLWRAAGPNRFLRLFAIAPLKYRLSRRSKVLYRRPAFLVCSDPDLNPEQVLRAYVSRWDIEVNFRDEKQIIRFDQAQVPTSASAHAAPAVAVAAYSILLLASARVFGVNGLPSALPPPKWRARETKPRASTSDLINHLRFALWRQAIRTPSFSHFPTPPHHHDRTARNADRASPPPSSMHNQEPDPLPPTSPDTP